MKITIKHETLGGHTHIGIWVNGGKAGNLCVTDKERDEFLEVLRLGMQQRHIEYYKIQNKNNTTCDDD